jgi:hypothetical protein
VKQNNEVIRFYFRDILLRITLDTGFEYLSSTKSWIQIEDLDAFLGPNSERITEVLWCLIDCADHLDDINPEMGTQIFQAAMRTPGMIKLGFRDATLN